MANTSYDVILRFLLDEASKQKTKAGVDALTGDLSDVDKIVRAATEDFETLEKQINQATSPKGFDSLERQLKDVDKQVKEITKSYSLQARVARAQAADMVNGFEKVRVAQLKAFGSRLGGISQTGLIASGALFGGVFAEANRFAQDAEDAGKATRATREWTAATKELAAARAKVDTVLLRESLPLLQRAAEIAKQAASFIEDNPAVIRAALETGKIVAGLSVLGILASKGIALVADAKTLLLGSQELAAAKIQDEAAKNQLKAALIQAEAAGLKTGGGAAKSASGLASAALPFAGLAVTSIAGSKLLGDQLDELGKRMFAVTKNAPLVTALISGIQNGLAPLFPFIGPLRQLKAQTPQVEEFIKKILGIGDAAKDAGQQLEQAATGLRGSAHESEIVAAFEKWQADDARIVAEAAERRVQIVRDAEKRIAQATAQFTSQVAGINAQAAKRAEELTKNFQQAEAQSEAQYQENRAQIIRDGGQAIRDIEEQHQERLRQMTMEHEERVEDLTASRDALGLAKEQRRFNQERAEEERSTRMEIAKRRADLAERLADLDRQNQAERAQRLVAFQEALAENEAQRKEQLKQAAAAFAEEQKQIRDQRAQQLRELQEGLNAERQRRREVFIEQVRDLDAALLGERELRARHYAQAIADAEAFFTAWRSKLPNASNVPGTPGFAVGGYASGLVRTGENGVEYILSNRTTRAAERMIGGRLTQDALLSTLARGAGSSRTINISDHSQFDGRISAREVRAIKQETIAEIARELGS